MFGSIFALLLASVAMFVALIQRISLLQINRMLSFTGDLGRQVIEAMYPRLDAAVADSARGVSKASCHPDPDYIGRPQALQALDERALLTLAVGIRRGRRSSFVHRRHVGRGDTSAAGPRRRQQVEEAAWKKAFETGRSGLLSRIQHTLSVY